MRLSRSVALSIAILLTSLCRSVQAAELAPERHRLAEAALAPWRVQGGPGCAVGVSINGRVDYEQAAGAADLAHRVPITSRTVFHAASISKQFTAFSVGLLEQRGRLSYGDPIRKFIPELPKVMDGITVEDLIHHTDGLREQGQLLYLAGWRPDDVLSQEDVLWALSRQRELNFAPGSEVVYGNAAYTLLAILVQRVTGTALRDFAAAEIFSPLGMTRTRFPDGYAEVATDRASSYVRGGDGRWVYAPLNIRHYGSTGLLTTVGDLLKWEQNLLDGRVGGVRLIQAMRTSGTLRDGTSIGYGHGLRLRPYRGLQMVSHDGVDAGFRAEALLFPSQRLAVVALCNASTADVGGMARRIADGYLGAEAGLPDLAPPVEMAVERQSALAGTYWSEQTDELIDLRWTGSALRAAGAGVDLVPIGDNLFRPADQPHEWRFEHTPSGMQTVSIKDAWPTRRSFARIDVPLPGNASLAAMVGRYRSDETDMVYLVTLLNGRLRLSWPRGNELDLTAAGGDRFFSAAGTVTFRTGEDGAYASLTISNRRLRRLSAFRLPEEASAGLLSHPLGARASSRPVASIATASSEPGLATTITSNPAGVAAPLGAYSHLAVVPPTAELIFPAGQIGSLPDGTILHGADAQYAQALMNIATLLKSRGAGPDQLVKLTIFLRRPLSVLTARASQLAAFGTAVPPASLVYVKRLARPDLLVEVEAIAAVLPKSHAVDP